MNIGSGSGYPSATLSNFSGHRFTIDGVECYSMEGFLQSLKFKHEHMQIAICKLVGKGAKFRGKGKKWYRNQELFWKGVTYKRDSEDYQLLLDRAYMAMYEQCYSFRKALLDTGNSNLTHTMGKSKISETVLTEGEFCRRLMKLRDNDGKL